MKVNKPSHHSTRFGLMTARTMTIHTYANRENNVVTIKGFANSIVLVSWGGTMLMQIAMITKRLKAALPTIVDGPSWPAWKSAPTISITANRISGAELPSAIRLRLATVGCQAFMITVLPCTFRTLRLLVMASMASMKTSAITLTPMKNHRRTIRLMAARNGLAMSFSKSNKGRSVPWPPGSQILGGAAASSPNRRQTGVPAPCFGRSSCRSISCIGQVKMELMKHHDMKETPTAACKACFQYDAPVNKATLELLAFRSHILGSKTQSPPGGNFGSALTLSGIKPACRRRCRPPMAAQEARRCHATRNERDH
mmetsp:Transcript_120083/g.339763  ORF Transcript_120083/g.339763 Transcript_120083/m.339763 type:complete len:312 (-) Transcript_120083:26-961(-)